jgi:hypothetical protein
MLLPQMPRIPRPSFRYASALAAHKYFLLFLCLLASLLINPFAETSAFGYYAFRVLASAAVLFCVYAVSFRRSLAMIAAALAIPAFAHRVLNLSVNASALSILNIALSFAFDAFIVVVIFRRVFGSSQPNAETIFGALCIYLLVGFAFVGIYGMIALLKPHSFYLDPMSNSHAFPDALDLVYYSFATMTSLGAAGITPVSGQARCVSVLEAIIGVLYLAVLISRLVGAYRHPPA